MARWPPIEFESRCLNDKRPIFCARSLGRAHDGCHFVAPGCGVEQVFARLIIRTGSRDAAAVRARAETLDCSTSTSHTKFEQTDRAR